MSKKHIQYSSKFKVKIALAVIRGDEAIPQLVARYGIHPTQINRWKWQLTEQAADSRCHLKSKTMAVGHFLALFSMEKNANFSNSLMEI